MIKEDATREQTDRLNVFFSEACKLARLSSFLLIITDDVRNSWQEVCTQRIGRRFGTIDGRFDSQLQARKAFPSPTPSSVDSQEQETTLLRDTTPKEQNFSSQSSISFDTKLKIAIYSRASSLFIL